MICCPSYYIALDVGATVDQICTVFRLCFAAVLAFLARPVGRLAGWVTVPGSFAVRTLPPSLPAAAQSPGWCPAPQPRRAARGEPGLLRLCADSSARGFNDLRTRLSRGLQPRHSRTLHTRHTHTSRRDQNIGGSFNARRFSVCAPIDILVWFKRHTCAKMCPENSWAGGGRQVCGKRGQGWVNLCCTFNWKKDKELDEKVTNLLTLPISKGFQRLQKIQSPARARFIKD